MMPYVGVRELKNRLGAYLRLVREGQTVYITDRGRPVAELRPLATAGNDEEAQLEALATRGIVAPRRRTKVTCRAEGIRIAGAPLSETVLDDRADRV